jgi:hypothetical protein
LEAGGGVFYIHIASTVDWHVETVIMREGGGGRGREGERERGRDRRFPGR